MAAMNQRDEYFFDLNGFVVLKGAMTRGHVVECNAILDDILALDPPLRHGEWFGGVHGHTYGGNEGMNLQQIYEAGEPFERMIDLPSWIDHVRHFVGGKGTFDWALGDLFIDENFASIRGPGQAIGLHSGGHNGTKRTQFRYHNGQFHCGQVNVLVALSDIGPGDGATMVIPGSHKANLEHPQIAETRMCAGETRSVDGVEGAIEVHLQAGDAIVFVDAINHGSAARVNAGERRICVYRYGPSWGNFRHGYFPTSGLLTRLTERQRRIVLPQQPMLRQPNRIAGFENPPHAIG